MEYLQQNESPDAKPEQPPKKLGDIEQRVLNCLVCLENPDTGLITGDLRNIELCSKIPQRKRWPAQERLRRKGLLQSYGPDDSEYPRDLPGQDGRQIYTFTEAGKQYTQGPKRCRFNFSFKPRSDNPYANCTETQKRVLDCVRCLFSQDILPTAASIAACQGVQSATMRSILNILEKNGTLTADTEQAFKITTPNGRWHTAYAATKQSEPYLTPKKMPECTVLQEELQQTLTNRSEKQRKVLGCFACQHRQVVAGERPAITTAAATRCLKDTDAVDVTSRGLAQQLATAKLLEQDIRGTQRQVLAYTATKLGSMLFSSLPDSCPAPPGVTAREIENAQTVEARIAHCVSCIKHQQQELGLPIGANEIMIQKCQAMPLEAVEKYAGRLVAQGVFVEHLAKHDIPYYATTVKMDTPRTPDCNYKITARFNIQAAMDIAARDDKGTVQLRADLAGLPVLSPEEEVRLATIIQESRDLNEVNLAANELFLRNIKLAMSEAWKYTERTYDRPDKDEVEQVALLSLFKGVEHFSPKLGYKFSTFFGRIFHNEISRQTAIYRGYSVTDLALINFISHQKRILTESRTTISDKELVAHIEGFPNRPKGNVAKTLTKHYARQKQVSLQQNLFRDEDGKTLNDVVSIAPSHEAETDFDVTLRHLMQTYAKFDEIDQKICLEMLSNQPDLGQLTEQYNLDKGELSKRKSSIIGILSHPSVGFLAQTLSAFAWQYEARCHTAKLHEFSVRGKEKYTYPINNVRQICRDCPVQVECRELYAQLTPRPMYGIWGGKSPAAIRKT